MKIYRHRTLDHLIGYYGEALMPKEDQSIKNHLSLLAEKMQVGLKNGIDCVYTQLNNYHPDYLGCPIDTLKSIQLDMDTCREAIANEYGFSDWEDVEHLGSMEYAIDFEYCVQYIVSGEYTKLKKRIEKNSSLLKQTSQYGHSATLLHYTGSNGHELWRQQVPSNLPDIIGLLLHSGADKDAKMNVYNGHFTALELLSTSAHPKEAGILNASIKAFSL